MAYSVEIWLMAYMANGGNVLTAFFNLSSCVSQICYSFWQYQGVF
jgi:hypothetical protein